MIALETARLRLIAADSALISADLDGSARLAEALGAEIPPDWPQKDLAEVMPFIAECIASDRAAAGWWLWYAVLKKENILCGSLGFKGVPDENGEAELGYGILPRFEKQGLATEAARKLCRWAMRPGWARRLVAQTFAANPASLRVLEKCGFSPAGAGYEPDALLFEKLRP